MTLPKVAIATGVANPPAPVQAEGHFLFIGTAQQGLREVHGVGPTTDLAALFGSGELADTLGAFRRSAGANWRASAYGYAGREVSLKQAAVVDKGSGKVGLPATAHGLLSGVSIVVSGTTNYNGTYTVEPQTSADEIVLKKSHTTENLRSGGKAKWTPVFGEVGGVLLQTALDACAVQPEGVVLCMPANASAELTTLQGRLATLLGQHKRIWALTRFRAREEAETWGGYADAFKRLTQSISAGRVLVCPTLWGNDQGAFAGAIARKATHASPIWPGYGPLQGVDAKPVDASGNPLTLGALERLSAAKASVLMWHEGLRGIYPAQGLPLAGAGEPERIEWLQMSDHLARAVRTRALMRLGKGVRDVPVDRAAFVQYVSAPVRNAAAAGQVQPVHEDDFQVAFPTPTSASLAFSWRPLDAAETISVRLDLDAS